MGKILYFEKCLKVTPSPKYILLGPLNPFLTFPGSNRAKEMSKWAKTPVFRPKMRSLDCEKFQQTNTGKVIYFLLTFPGSDITDQNIEEGTK